MKTIADYPFKGKRVLVRVDFNVPLDKQDFSVTDDSRIRGALPTINKILNDGGTVILMSHLGRPKGGPEDKYSLRHIVAHTSGLLQRHVKFVADCVGDTVKQTIDTLKPGDVLLLENLRFHPEEEKGDEAFARELSLLGDVYVNDAFGTAHRAHASTAIIAKYFSAEDKMFGYLMAAEIENADKAIKNPQHPFTAIIGGAKVSDKILIMEQLLDKADYIIIGGGMAYTFFRALGGNVGNSLCEMERLETAKALLDKAKEKNVQIILPQDSVIADAFDNNANISISESSNIPDGWMGLDIGSKSIAAFRDVILKSKTILWNGPMGVFEMSNFQGGTKGIALAVAEATSQGAFSLVGGGDSVAAVNTFGIANHISYISTGGGAMLEYFEGKQLPGIYSILH
ncbi:MAG: phosphoglycerate kinase [Bacteroidetes bacterium]|nr:phosphoglycerate kinase [Bacteroidota bacterium]GDX48085.1 phosphoglycerate kinase [Bacteroidota bacterium]